MAFWNTSRADLMASGSVVNCYLPKGN